MFGDRLFWFIQCNFFLFVDYLHNVSYTIQTSRASSPDNDFVDVESTTDNRPHSSASGNFLKQSGPPLITPMPEVKRNRGRPRKVKDPAAIADDGKVFRVKRGRGRPRKNSLNSNLSNTQNSYLEEGKLRMHCKCYLILTNADYRGHITHINLLVIAIVLTSI